MYIEKAGIPMEQSQLNSCQNRINGHKIAWHSQFRATHNMLNTGGCEDERTI